MVIFFFSLPSPLLMQSLLYSIHFSRYFLFLTSYSLCQVEQDLFFPSPSLSAWMAQLSFCAFSTGVPCWWWLPWPCREAEPAPHPAPPQNQPEQLLWWGEALGKGQDPQGVSAGCFWAVSPAEVAGGAPCCPQDAGGAVNRLEQLFFALLEYSLGSHWMHDFTMSLAFPGRLRLCCKF